MRPSPIFPVTLRGAASGGHDGVDIHAGRLF